MKVDRVALVLNHYRAVLNQIVRNILKFFIYSVTVLILLEYVSGSKVYFVEEKFDIN